MHVLLLGHSFTRRLKDYITFQGLSATFNLSEIQQISWHFQDGLCINDLWENSGPTVAIQSTIQSLHPSHVYIELGTNDLVQATPNQALVLASQILDFVEWLHLQGSITIICGQILPRLPDLRPIPIVARYDYQLNLAQFERNRSIVNNFLHATLPEVSPSSKSWTHSRLESRHNLYHADGLHFNSQGLKHYYKSVRGALIHMAKHDSKHFFLSLGLLPV